MRQPEYHSPSSIRTFFKDRDEYYLRYLADNRPPRLPQTIPMAVGAAFDAYIKSYLIERLFGAVDGQRFEDFFEAQVEPQNRDQALIDGKIVFDMYLTTGAMLYLMEALKRAIYTPRFESEIRAQVRISDEYGSEDIPLLGKPDVYYIHRTQDDVLVHIIEDFKVNGFYSKSKTSPRKGFIKSWDAVPYTNKSHNQSHKDCVITIKDGLEINAACCIEDSDESWGDQCSIYAWILGEPIGSSATIGIHQITGAPTRDGDRVISLNQMRVSLFRSYVSKQFQIALAQMVLAMVRIIKTGHIFSNLSREESDLQCQKLDDLYKAFDPSDINDQWYREVLRQHRGF